MRECLTWRLVNSSKFSTLFWEEGLVFILLGEHLACANFYNRECLMRIKEGSSCYFLFHSPSASLIYEAIVLPVTTKTVEKLRRTIYRTKDWRNWAVHSLSDLLYDFELRTRFFTWILHLSTGETATCYSFHGIPSIQEKAFLKML